MRSAISVGSSVVAVEVTQREGNFTARRSAGNDAGETALIGQGETYEAALVALRRELLAHRAERAQRRSH